MGRTNRRAEKRWDQIYLSGLFLVCSPLQYQLLSLDSLLWDYGLTLQTKVPKAILQQWVCIYSTNCVYLRLGRISYLKSDRGDCSVQAGRPLNQSEEDFEWGRECATTDDERARCESVLPFDLIGVGFSADSLHRQGFQCWFNWDCVNKKIDSF